MRTVTAVTVLRDPQQHTAGRQLARTWCCVLCPLLRPWSGFHRLPPGRGDAALLSALGLLLLLHGGPSGTGQPGIKRGHSGVHVSWEEL